MRLAHALAFTLALGTAAPALAQTPMADGEVRRIDAENGKITLRHGPIKSLQMDTMTMVFRVQSADMLKGLKVGDKVKFVAERVEGQITITRMEKAR